MDQVTIRPYVHMTKLLNFYVAVTILSGTQWKQAYETVDSFNHTIVGGVAPGGDVGAAGGWVQGGGHSIISPTYGLGQFAFICYTFTTELLYKALIMLCNLPW